MTRVARFRDKKAGHGARAGGRPGVLLARVPRGLRRARLLAQPGVARRRRAAPRRTGLLHEPWFGHGPGARRGGRRRLRRLQSRGGGAGGRVRLDQGGRAHHLRGAHAGCGRPAGAGPRARARRVWTGATELLAAGGGSAAARGQAALRRPAQPRPARAIRWATCGAWPTCCASTAATPTRRRGRRPASTPPRSGCSPSSTGASRCAPTSAPGPGPTSSSMRRRRRLSDRGLVADGALTAEGRALRESVEVATDAQCEPSSSTRSATTFDELLGVLVPWGQAIRDAGGYPPQGPHDLAPVSLRAAAQASGRCSVPSPGVMNSASPGSWTRAVCQTFGRVHHGLARSQLDDVLGAVDLLHDVDADPRAGRRPPRRPGAAPSRPRSRPGR